MSYPQTSVPETQHTVWYAHSIMINGKVIGSFERMSIRASRDSERIREIMFSRGPETKEIVWGGTNISIDLNRVELYNESAMEAMNLAIFSLEDFTQFVDILEYQYNPNNDGNRLMTYKDCVATAWNKDLDTGTVRIVESMSFECRTIRGSRTS